MCKNKTVDSIVPSPPPQLPSLAVWNGLENHSCKTKSFIACTMEAGGGWKQARSDCRYATVHFWFCITGTFINISSEYFVRHPECKTEEGLQ